MRYFVGGESHDLKARGTTAPVNSIKSPGTEDSGFPESNLEPSNAMACYGYGYCVIAISCYFRIGNTSSCHGLPVETHLTWRGSL